MRNITLSARDILIQKAREKARAEHTTLNELFRNWLVRYTGTGKKADEYSVFMRKFTYPVPGRKFTRMDMNER